MCTHEERRRTLQAQLLTLSKLCWSEAATGPVSVTNSAFMSDIMHSTPQTQPGSDPTPQQTLQPSPPGCRWAAEGFPQGPALLDYLYNELQESDSRAAPLVRFLFLSAFQPYVCHMRSWLYSTAAVTSSFAAAACEAEVAKLPQLPDCSVSCTAHRMRTVVASLCGVFFLIPMLIPMLAPVLTLLLLGLLVNTVW